MMQPLTKCLQSKQGSSASQKTAAKVMGIMARLPGCAGQAADAISACTQFKMEDAPSLLHIPKSECPDIWKRLPQHKWPKSWSSMEDPVVPLQRNCLFVNRGKGSFLSVYVDDVKLAGKKQNVDPNVERTHERSRFGRTNIIP